MANTIAPQIDTGVRGSFSAGVRLSSRTPGLLEGNALVTEPFTWHVRGARQRLASGPTKVSVKARNKVGGQTIL